ncbi:MAG TPA: TetR family transcriptional regulator [Solirubrobacteraceae bacterium]|jgi:AcrR family transcriptional regulator|nr:TetR family transcriptional regulator [Solirubrobacteraceae bacterium]
MAAAPSDTTTDRGTQLLDEALRLLAAGGLGAVTHRSVESAAKAPHGSVTYWFASRDGLVAAMVERLVSECEGQVGAIAEQIAAAFAAGGEPDVEAVASGLAAWIDGNRDLHLARLELELAAIRDPRLAERMRDAALVFWRMCEPLALATGSADPERDGRAIAVMVDGLLLDRLAHPPQSHDLLVASVRQLLASRASRS